jgi:glycosyltransferase involved in cell wall biosynthesis
VRLAALVESPDHVCCRYRLRAFEPLLERAGHTLTLIALPRSIWSRWRLFRSLGAYDVVILQRKLLARFEMTLLRRHARQLLFDFDDALWLRDSQSPKGFNSRRRRNRFRFTVRSCDAVVGGNAFLSDNAARWAGAQRCTVIPTCVDSARYPLAKHSAPPGSAQLVWVGSTSTLRGLERARPILETLGREIPGLALKLICDCFFTLEHLPVHPVPWSEATEAIEIAAADIGLSWVPDDPWSRGKCGLKMLQYLAAGLPVVANPVGVQSEMVRHGETGFLASTVDEWLQAVRALASDPALRRRMGAAGRRLVEAHYRVECGGEKWVRLLRSLEDVRVPA